MFAINKPRMDAVALLMMTALPFTAPVSLERPIAPQTRRKNKPTAPAVPPISDATGRDQPWRRCRCRSSAPAESASWIAEKPAR
jgi:hypothetical protein